MHRLYIILLLFLFHDSFSQQPSDFILVKKKSGRVLQYFIAGSTINYITIFERQVTGPILSIKNDSIYVRMYDIRPVVNGFGIEHLDTLGSSIIGNSINDINRIQIHRHKNLLISTLDRLTIIGGVGYFALNIFNGAYLNNPITSSANLRKLGISAGAFAIGIAIRKGLKMGNLYSSRSDRIEYVHMKITPIH